MLLTPVVVLFFLKAENNFCHFDIGAAAVAAEADVDDVVEVLGDEGPPGVQYNHFMATVPNNNKQFKLLPRPNIIQVEALFKSLALLCQSNGIFITLGPGKSGEIDYSFYLGKAGSFKKNT